MSMAHATPNPEKGARYVEQLDQALCNGSWGQVGELARKVDKHAPKRTSLTIAARAEAHIASALNRPTSVSSTASNDLDNWLQSVQEAVASTGQEYADDVYIADTCIAEIYWLQQNPVAVLEILTRNIASRPETATGKFAPLGWLEVCNVKRTFLQAEALHSSARQSEARTCYLYAVTMAPGYRSPELRRWTERLLAAACIYTVKKIPSPELQDLGETYSVFRAWGGFWQRVGSNPAGSAPPPDAQRRHVWKEYYDLLSYVLQHSLLFNLSANSSSGYFLPEDLVSSEDQRLSARLHLRTEMKRVEAAYESLLLAETSFPKASQSNTEVENWAEQVVNNWRVFCGASWTDSDLVDGSKQSVSRGVLDILYRAATKTFHSTAILRQLFTVHASLGEFDMAMHAFDSYADIVDRGKARAEKTGEHELGFDDEDTAMLTAAEAVRILCRYGDREQAEKANQVCDIMQTWLDRQLPAEAVARSIPDDVAVNGDGGTRDTTASALKSQTLAAAYRAIGISQAHWALLTYDGESRASLLAEANNNLRRSTKFDADNVNTAYALAFVLAEMRDLPAATTVIKTAIATASTDAPPGHLTALWHLLALCLTGEEALELAAQVCSNTIDQLDDDAGLESMEGILKENLLQVKMTQILLFEVMEGAEEAIDFTSELLGLYSRLFGTPEDVSAAIAVKPPVAVTTVSPTKPGGTLRSLAGSIRPRSSRSPRSSLERHIPRQQSIASTVTARPQSNGNGLSPPIAITVTNEDGTSSTKPRGHQHYVVTPSLQGPGQEKATASPQDPERKVEQRLMEKVPHSASHDDERPVRDVRLSAPHPLSAQPPPVPQFSITHQRRYQVNVLVGVWLFITQLYVRANGLEDARSAFDEAVKLTNLLEMDLAASEEGTNARKLYGRGWGGGKSIDELWGDLWCTVSAGGRDGIPLLTPRQKAQLASASDLPFEAMANYEQALAYFPDHPAGIVGLSALLMDIYEEKMPPEAPQPPLQLLSSASGSLINELRPSLTRPNSSATMPPRRPSIIVEGIKDGKNDPLPAELNRLAARDRAYMLLYNLTKLGSGRDDSEAWFTLARAHELSREIAKAKQALWWVVELEELRPIRAWHEAVVGGYTL